MHSFPIGWYGVALSSQLGPGQILSKTICGTNIVVWRGENGVASIMSAYCPHLGAHLGHGGKVIGNNIRCPFHGFSFAQDGRCLAKINSVPVFPVCEQDGMIFMFYHPHRSGALWSLPKVDSTGYLQPNFATFHFAGQVQDIAENVVDTLHFQAVHHYDKLTFAEPLQIEGPFMQAHFQAQRDGSSFWQKEPIHLDFVAKVYGLGYSQVDSIVSPVGVHARSFVWATPVKDSQIELTVALMLKKIENVGKISPWLHLLPKWLTNEIVRSLSFRAFKNDFCQDVPIFANKTHVAEPSLSPKDGPIMVYRKWTEQFFRKSNPQFQRVGMNEGLDEPKIWC